MVLLKLILNNLLVGQVKEAFILIYFNMYLNCVVLFGYTLVSFSFVLIERVRVCIWGLGQPCVAIWGTQCFFFISSGLGAKFAVCKFKKGVLGQRVAVCS